MPRGQNPSATKVANRRSGFMVNLRPLSRHAIRLNAYPPTPMRRGAADTEPQQISFGWL
jgi:hypothetical protein